MVYKTFATALLTSLALLMLMSSGCGKKQDEAAISQTTAAPSATHNVGAAPAAGYTSANDSSADAQKYRAQQQSAPGAKAPYAR